MTILTFLGTVDIADTDDYGKIHLRLAFDLIESVRKEMDSAEIKEKACNIVKVCCEPMFDDLIEAYSWGPEETAYADRVLVKCMKMSVTDLVTLATRRIRHQRKYERQAELQIKDLKIAAILAFVMNVPIKVSDQLEDTFLDDHGAMNFDS